MFELFMYFCSGMKSIPIKRSKELAPLSRDHHQGLLLCWKIRNGVNNHIDNKRIARYLIFSFREELSEHFRQEEDILFSLLADDEPLKQQALGQHASLRAQVEEVTSQKEPDTTLLLAFADTLDTHIRFEERKLFPFIEQTIDEGKLQTAGKKIDACQHTDQLQWEDQFWKKIN